MRYLLPLVLLVLLLAGCGGTPPSPAAGTTPEANAEAPAGTPGSYPGPGYPGPGYPGPGTGEGNGPAFVIDGPIRTASGQITGTGPAGVPIRVINFMREESVIAETVINERGQFVVATTDYAQGDIIGLTLGDITGTDLRAEDFASGPGYKDILGYGIIFDTEVVLE